MHCTFSRTQVSAGRTVAKPRQQPVCHATRRQFGAQLLTIGVGLFAAAGASYADEKGAAAAAAAPSTSPNTAGPSAITITPINKAAKSYLDMRDEAMEYQCKGGMFDCDGDRREFAHKQYMDWLAAGGVPKRIREGNPGAPRSY